MIIGSIKEKLGENRTALTPEVVGNLLKLKVEKVLAEQDLGTNAGFTNPMMSEAGAIMADRKKVLSESDIIITIHPPQPEDISSLRKGAIWIAAFNPFFNREIISHLASSGITAMALEFIPRTTRAQAMDILSSMATVSGYKAVLAAASSLPRFFPMMMTAAGSIKPAKVLILGAGVAGLQAIATAKKLGAVVEAFDVRAVAKEEVLSLGAKFVEVEGATDDKTAGGYAVEQSEEYKRKQAQAIHDHAIKSDVVICTAQIPGRKAPVLLTRETVMQMSPGSVIVDLAASTGGNCACTEREGLSEVNGVKIIGQSGFPSDMPGDASRMFSRNILSLLKLLINKEGNLALDFEDDILTACCLTHDGAIVNERIK